jgi:hypothetical protein
MEFLKSISEIGLAWVAGTVLIMIVCYIITKFTKRLADSESELWDMCVKYPNDEDLGREIRKHAWEKREADKKHLSTHLSMNI